MQGEGLPGPGFPRTQVTMAEGPELIPPFLTKGKV